MLGMLIINMYRSSSSAVQDCKLGGIYASWWAKVAEAPGWLEPSYYYTPYIKPTKHHALA